MPKSFSKNLKIYRNIFCVIFSVAQSIMIKYPFFSRFFKTFFDFPILDILKCPKLIFQKNF